MKITVTSKGGLADEVVLSCSAGEALAIFHSLEAQGDARTILGQQVYQSMNQSTYFTRREEK